MQPNHIMDNAHPAATGAILSTLLPWDHVTNVVWAVVGSVASWLAVKLVSWGWQKVSKKGD